MSAVLERERRVTAGKRTTNVLVGEELENDETFWTHDTWKDDDDDDEANQSYHSSDVSSDADVDEFDSDFDMSENDDTEAMNEEIVGAAIEREIEIEEREQKKKKNAYTESSSSMMIQKKNTNLLGRTGKKKGGFGRGRKSFGNGVATLEDGTTGNIGPIKRVVGDGLNAGIVLNVPIQYRMIKSTIPPSVQQQQQPHQQTSLPPATITTTMTQQQEQTAILPTPVVISIDKASKVSTTTSTTQQTEKFIDEQRQLQQQASPSLTEPPLTLTVSDSVVCQPNVVDANTTTVTTSNSNTLPSPAIKKRGVNRGPTLASTRVRRSVSNNNDDDQNIHAKTTKRGRPSLRKSIDSAADSDVHVTTTEKAVPSGIGLLKRGRQLYKQEELLVEAIHETEPHNERWILEQKRNQAIKDDMEDELRIHNQSLLNKNTIVIEKFVSRRGYNNTITFPNMDHIPDILQQHRSNDELSSKSNRDQQTCIITGKVAKYRDPKTGYGYYNVEAFHELRRRYEANELLPLQSKYTAIKVKKFDTTTNTQLASLTLPEVTVNGSSMITGTVNGSTKLKRKSKASVAVGTTKTNEAPKRGRPPNGKLSKQSLQTERIPKRRVNKTASATSSQAPPLQQSKRQRTTSTGTAGENESMPILLSPGRQSKVTEVEIISRNGMTVTRVDNQTAMIKHNHHTNGGTTMESPILSPGGGRKSPRTPKPTVKVLESIKAIATSIVGISPTQQQRIQLPVLSAADSTVTRNQLSDTSATTTMTLSTAHHTNKLPPHLPLPTSPVEK